MIAVLSLSPAPLNRLDPLGGGQRRGGGKEEGECGVECKGPSAELILALLPWQPHCFFHVENAAHGRRLLACWFSVSLHFTPYSNHSLPPLLQLPLTTSTVFNPLNQDTENRIHTHISSVLFSLNCHTSVQGGMLHSSSSVNNTAHGWADLGFWLWLYAP